MKAVHDRATEEQENILTKSFSFFKSVAATGSKIIKETLKDLRKQAAMTTDLWPGQDSQHTVERFRYISTKILELRLAGRCKATPKT